MYKIIGADQQEYGPVSGDELRQWIGEGRVNGQTPAKAEGDATWKTVAAFPEFAMALAGSPSATMPPPPLAAGGYSTLPADILQRDYDLDIGSCISRSWELLKNNFGIVAGGTALYILIQIGVNMVAQIPLLGVLVSLAMLFITGPLMGGVYYFMLKNIRREPVEVGDVFLGFKFRFIALMLVYLVQLLISCIVMMPGVITMLFGLIPIIRHQEPNSTQIAVMVAGGLIALVPVMYLSVCWTFSLALAIDKQMDFWPAMETSRRVVGKHWWSIFALTIVGALIVVVSLLLCCLPVFVGIPLFFGAMMYAYEDIFGQRTPTA